jgi:hypothetical protein
MRAYCIAPASEPKLKISAGVQDAILGFIFSKVPGPKQKIK